MAVNILIFVVLISVCSGYIKNLQVKHENESKSNFVSMVGSMRKGAGGYLISHQQSCNDWSAYINSHDMTLDEAIEYLKTTNSSDGVMGHIIEYDTMEGYSTDPDENGNYAIDYSVYEDSFNRLEDLMLSNNDDIEVFITPTYKNPVNDELVIGFCNNINLTDNHSCMLIRTVSIDNINDSWVFPSDYGIELSLINNEGDFIICSDSIKGSNLWKFIKETDDFEESEIESLKDEILSDSTVFNELTMADGNEIYLVTMPSIRKGNWHYIGYVQKSNMNYNKIDFTMAFIISIGFLLLLIVDVIYFLYINHRLRESAEETWHANQAKTQFLSSMSHDIRTPMNAIIGITALSAKHIDDPEYMRESLKKITLAGNHLLTLINDILDISKVESGKFSINPTIFSLAELAMNLTNIVRPQIKEKNQEFNINIRNIKHEYLFADELRLNQIFINLLTNAVKYTPDGGKINLEISETPAEDDKNVILTYTISDNGIGMSEKFQKTMHETFARASDSRIDKIQGAGLGLAITKQIVEIMGGSIECQSELGKGTTFIVRVELPVGEKITDELMLPPMKILVVDDNDTFLETASDTLALLGISADTAMDGKTAVRMVTEKHEQGNDYPIIIVDWKMPDMDGIETIRQIRAKVGSVIPIIIVSAYEWTEIKEEAIEAGANGFINKPFFRSTVYSKMIEILGLEVNDENPEDDSFECFEGLNLLVAEDNDLNWEIIHEILEEFEIKSERAENGKIAVEMLTKNDSYDAVFMDIQMPVMNGREASRAIRSSDDERLRKIPIIAMTADAFEEDIRACLDAGMNGHVAKPIEVKKIFDELRKTGVSARNKKGNI